MVELFFAMLAFIGIIFIFPLFLRALWTAVKAVTPYILWGAVILFFVVVVIGTQYSLHH